VTTDGATQLVFAATSAGVYCSADLGDTWAAASASDIVPFNEVIVPSPRFAQDRTLFVGGRNGLYRSLDGGASWQCVLTGGHVMGLAVAPDGTQGSVVFAGTEQDGIVRSEDGGRTWASANPGLLDLTVLALAVSPAFGQDGTGLAATASGLYRTRNAGKSWREIDLGAEVAVQCLAFSPAFADDRLALAGTESDGLLRSSDAGAGWEPVSGLDGRSVTALAFSNRYASNGTIVAATDVGIALSVDGGRSWRITAADPGPVLTLACVPHPEGDVVLAGLHRDGVARVATDGADWTFANAGLQARLLLGLVLSPAFEADQTMFAAGPDDGLLVSRDAGQTWAAHLVGPQDPSVFGVALSSDYRLDGTVYAATAAGVQRSRDGGATWQSLPVQAESGAARAVVVAGACGTPVLAALANGTLLASEDRGESWHALGDGFGEGRAEIVSLAVSPEFDRDRTICVGTSSTRLGQAGEVTVWRSVDAGLTWHRWLVERGGEPVPLVVPRGQAVTEVAFVGLGGQMLKPMRGTSETRRGERRPMWRGVQVGGPRTLITALAAPPDDASGRVVFAATSTGVYVSRDGGDHFAAWDAASGPGAVIGLAVSPTYASDHLVYALEMGGAVWRRHDT
jgi:photosystem II stability/assembly factor-like uncharacterized protein